MQLRPQDLKTSSHPVDSTYDIKSTNKLAIDPELWQTNQLPGKAALGRAGRTLHEKHDGRGLDKISKTLEKFLLLLLGILLLDSDVVRIDAVGGAGICILTRLLGLCLDRRAHLDSTTATNSLDNLTIPQKNEEGNGSNIVGLAKVAQLLRVD
ncbi:hypothetical protein HG530_012850 [Fusarium avenaceum]|nr:hypothetical protein HG530_012850 [Fusarium avenaceum]